jgi:hypothetical protein
MTKSEKYEQRMDIYMSALLAADMMGDREKWLSRMGYGKDLYFWLDELAQLSADAIIAVDKEVRLDKKVTSEVEMEVIRERRMALEK